MYNHGMEHPNVVHGPPWTWWPGGPPKDKNIQFDIQLMSEGHSAYECWMCTPTLTQTQDVKNRIDAIQRHGVWDDYKKITNPYEYVFLSLNRRMSRSVATRQPLSRSYFKMLELWIGANIYQEILPLITRDGGLYTSHAAEGPGGFIEAIHDMLPGKVRYSQGMTLRSTTRNIPGWRKTSAFLSKHPEININYGVDDTGDLLKLENLDYFVEKQPQKAHIYTADGGFDFSSDFNAQEETILPLLTAEFYLGLSSIQRGGVIVVKIFDTTLRPTLELIWMVTRCFREWSTIKPRTSRGGNAERYLVCKGFLGMDAEMNAFFRKAITQTGTIKSLLLTRPDRDWIQTMMILQEAISIQETFIIQRTLKLIEKPDRSHIREFIEQNVERSIQWCNEHKEPINQKWLEEAWKQKTIEDEIKELLNGYENNKNTISNFTGWRGLSEVSQTDSQEQTPQQQTRHAVSFSRTRPPRVEKASSRGRRAGSPDAEGWQKV